MNKILEESFEEDLKNTYDNIFSLCKPYNNQGINETNLTVNFTESLKKELGNDSISLYEIKLKEEKINGVLKHSRVDSLAYSESKNSIFYIEAKKFKRSQLGYMDKLAKDIKRLILKENRDYILNSLDIKSESLNQYCVFIADHWNKKNSIGNVEKWFSQFDQVNLSKNENFKGLSNIYNSKIEIKKIDDETYMIYIMVLKLN